MLVDDDGWIQQA